MAQIAFEQNFNYWEGKVTLVNNATLSFIPMEIRDSVSLNTFNIGLIWGSSSSNGTFSASIGLYSLTGSSLSIINSFSGSRTLTSGGVNPFNGFFSITTASATQNITPGNWWLGLLFSISQNTILSLVGALTANPANAFPGSFIGGAMTDSTNALPASFATSNLDITGSDAMFVPSIIISA